MRFLHSCTLQLAEIVASGRKRETGLPIVNGRAPLGRPRKNLRENPPDPQNPRSS